MTELITFNFAGVADKRVLTKEMANQIPVFQALLELPHAKNTYFVDRSVHLFDAVLMYVEYEHYPENVEEQWEIGHYGIVSPANSEEYVQAVAQMLTEQMSNDGDDDAKPFYVSANGQIFVTTTARLGFINFFRAVFTNKQFKQQAAGTADDPYYINVPPPVFSNLLRYLREPRNKLDSATRKVVESFSGFAEELLLQPTAAAVSGMEKLRLTNSGHTMTSDERWGGCLLGCCIDGCASRENPCTPVETINVRETSFSLTNIILTPETDVNAETCCYRYVLPHIDYIGCFHVEWKVTNTCTGDYVSPSSLLELDPLIPFKLIKCAYIAINNTKYHVVHGFQLHQRSTLDPYSLQPQLDGTTIVHLPFMSNVEMALPIRILYYCNVELILNVDTQFIPPGLRVIPTIHATVLLPHRKNWTNFVPLYFNVRCMHSEPQICTQVQKKSDTNSFTINLDCVKLGRCSAIFFSLHLDDSDNGAFYPIDDLIHCRLLYFKTPRFVCNHFVASKLNKIGNANIRVHPHVAVYALVFSVDVFNQKTAFPHDFDFAFINDSSLEVLTSDRVRCVRVWGLHSNVACVAQGTFGFMYTAQ